MQEKTPVFHTENPHSKKFEEFHNGRLFDRLEKKFTVKPFWRANLVLYRIALIAGFTFHIFSIAASATLVFFFIKALTESSIIAGLFTVVGLGLLETSKRITSERLFSSWFQFRKVSPGLAGVAVLLAAMSITAAFFGSQRAVHEFTPPPELVTSDSITGTLNERLATIDRQITDAKKNHWKGKLTPQAARTVEKLTNQRERITDALLDREERVQSKNDNTETSHKADTTATGAKFAAFSLLIELLLVLCLYFQEHYDYRSFAEICAPDPNGDKDDPTPTPPRPFSANRKERPVSATLPAEPSDGNAWSKVFDQSVGNATSTQQRPSVITAPLITQPLPDRMKKNCDHCGAPYTAKVAWQRFCSEGCKLDHHQGKHGKRFDPRRVKK